MRTRIRISAALLCIFILGLLGAAIVTYVFKTESRPESWVTPFFSALFFVPFLSVVIWRTILIRINEFSKNVTFTYPFRLKRRTYGFSEITGFRFQYRDGRMVYKALQFRTSDGQRFTVSDCETANLRKLESFCLDHFELCAGKAFKELNETEKQEEVNKSRQFDVTQAKVIRFHLYWAALFVLIVNVMLVRRLVEDEFPVTVTNGLMLMAFNLALVLILIKLIRVSRQRRMSKHVPHDPS